MLSRTARFLTIGTAVATAVLLSVDSGFAQCSMCRTALEQNPEAAAGFNRAILFLLAAPYAVFGSVTGYLVVSRRLRTGPDGSRALDRPDYSSSGNA